MRWLLLFFLMAFVGINRGSAQERVPQSSLYDVQAQLIQRNALAWQLSDFKRSVEIFREMREVTVSRRDEYKHLDVPDIDFILRDMEKIQEFQPEQKAIVKSCMTERLQGNEYMNQGDSQKAYKHFHRALELTTSLFDKNSFMVIDSKLSVARALAIDDKQESFDSGIALALEVQNTFENQQMTNSIYYRHILDVVTKLYFRKGNFTAAVEVGGNAVDLYAEHQAEGTGEAAMLMGVVAESYNRLGKHQQALQYSRNGLNNNPRLGGRYGVACVRLLQEYTRAKIALEDFENVGHAFDRLLEVSDQFASKGYFPADKRIEYRKEYIDFLNSQGDTSRANQLQQEIRQIELRAPLQKSKFSDM